MRGVGRPYLSPICESRGVFFFFRCECQILIGGLMSFYVSAIILLLKLFTVYVMLYYVIYYLYIYISDILIYNTIIDICYILL